MSLMDVSVRVQGGVIQLRGRWPGHRRTDTEPSALIMSRSAMADVLQAADVTTEQRAMTNACDPPSRDYFPSSPVILLRRAACRSARGGCRGRTPPRRSVPDPWVEREPVATSLSRARVAIRRSQDMKPPSSRLTSRESRNSSRWRWNTWSARGERELACVEEPSRRNARPVAPAATPRPANGAAGRLAP